MSITLDPRTTALVLIDMQKGILGMRVRSTAETLAGLEAER
jgi:nicotinamidase-related amidase